MTGGQARCGCAALLLALAALSGCGEQPREPRAARVTSPVLIGPPTLYNNVAPIPGNGGWLIGNLSGETPAIEVHSLAAPETSIAGTLRELDQYRVWAPITTIPEGVYSVTIISESYGTSTDTFEITAPRTFGKPLLESDPVAKLGENNGTLACCWQEGDRRDISCFTIDTESFIALTPGITTSESPSALTQLLFDLRPAGEPSIYRPDLFSGSLDSMSFDTQADEYCFDLIVTEIATGEQYAFDELDHCAPHGDLPDFGTRPLEPDDSVFDRAVCPAPPAGFADRWCEVNEAPCTAAPASAGCALAGHVCRGEPLPGTMTTGGSSGEGGEAGMTTDDEDPTAGENAAGEAGSSDEPSAPAKHVTACSVSSRRATGLGLAPALLGAALGLLLIRRRVRAGRPTRAALLALVALLAACTERSSEPAVASTAAAVVISQPLLINNTAPIPGNGSFLIWTQFNDAPTVDVRSTAAPATAIAGNLRKLEGYWVWTADSTLPEGSYTVSISDPTFPSPMEELVEITGERTFQKPALTADPQIGINEVLADYACCWSLINRMRVETLCFAVEWHEGVLLSTNVSTSESASALTQLLFEITPAMQPELGEPYLFGGGSTAFTFEAQADEYCFDISVIEITTGERYTFDELKRCVPHDMRELTTRAVEPTAGDLDSTVCSAPPDGFEASWCEVNEESCAAAPGRAGCELAGHTCRGEPLPGTVTTGGTGGMVSSGGAGGGSGMSSASGSGGDEASGPTAGSDDRDEPSPSEEAEDPELRTAGCGCRVYPRRETLAWPALGLLGAAVGLLRSAGRSRFRAPRVPGRSPPFGSS